MYMSLWDILLGELSHIQNNRVHKVLLLRNIWKLEIHKAGFLEVRDEGVGKLLLRFWLTLWLDDEKSVCILSLLACPLLWQSMTKGDLGKKGLITSCRSEFVMKGSQGRNSSMNLKAETEAEIREEWCLLGFHGFSCLLFYTIQDTILPGSHPAHSVLGTETSHINY